MTGPKWGGDHSTELTAPEIFNSCEEFAAFASRTGMPGHDNSGNAQKHLRPFSELLINDYPVLNW